MPGASAVQDRRQRTPREVELLEHRRPIIVTIDGPAGTGKSTVARMVAKRLGIDFLDTGAMYRAAAAIVIDEGIDAKDVDALVGMVERADVRFDFGFDPPLIKAFGEPIDKRIREADVTRIVSPIAGIARLREHFVEKQREIGRQHPRLVTEGRDQGSVVFPDAAVKFYLDASPRVRAERRAAQLRESGQEADEGRLLAEITERDRSDMSRKVGPLMCPADAVRVDTSGLTLDQVVDELERRTMELAGR
jgi:cytidylate kinase